VKFLFTTYVCTYPVTPVTGLFLINNPFKYIVAIKGMFIIIMFLSPHVESN